MSDTVIQVENLGKKYIIGHQKAERYTALRDVIAMEPSLWDASCESLLAEGRLT
jgi:hypothetical protein